MRRIHDLMEPKDVASGCTLKRRGLRKRRWRSGGRRG